MENMQDIFIGDEGSGTPLVLVHGFLGSTEMWRPQIKHFKENFRVLSPALPGFGKSNKLQSCDSIKCMAEKYIECFRKKTN
jgi:pimeloyl-ACP methyl ester carboxylesterase